MNNKSHVAQLKKEVLIRLIQAFLSENFTERADKIPFDIRPKDSDVTYRCCIHKERAVLRLREIAALGFAIEKDNESSHLSEYAKKSIEREFLEPEVLTVIDTACKGCVPSRVIVTDMCQGCIARPCQEICPFEAISVRGGKSEINPEKCKNCMKCVSVCPYNAIAKLVVPCEDACPVDAIKKNEKGVAEIDYDKCINCGVCISRCPFGAVAEKSQIIDILRAIKSDKKVIAMIAPSIVGQIPVKIGQIAQGLIKAGFDDVYEVALGADCTAKNEAEEFKERINGKSEFMTTSCCTSYREFAQKHAPEIKPFMSKTPTPMHYTAKRVKQEIPDCITVFVGPCVAKRKEALEEDTVDFVMNFEEMEALFVTCQVELAKCDEFRFKHDSSSQGRGFAVSNGVIESIRAVIQKDKVIKPICIDGLDRKSIQDLKKWANNQKCPAGNFIEVMACSGGCVGGSSVLNEKKITVGKIRSYSSEGKDITILK